MFDVSAFLSSQNDLTVIDEKQTGAPPMDIDDLVVSVKDRKHSRVPLVLVSCFLLGRRSFRCQISS